MTPPPLGRYVVCPQGLFVQVEGIQGGAFGGPRDWIDAILRDFRQPPNRIEFLVPQQMAKKKNDGSIYLLEEQLNLIKDYLPKFDYLIVDPYYSTWPEPDNFDIRNANQRVDHVFACRDAARLFIQYLQAWHITIPKIHWYINPEANLSYFNEPYKTAYKEYISFFMQVMMAVSANEGLNEPEFLWSPLFLSDTVGSVDNIKDLLLNVPKLPWMHVQDSVGAKAVKHATTGDITYERDVAVVVNYFKHFIIPAAEQANLKSLRVNMEMYVFDDHDPPIALPADPVQRHYSQEYYKQYNIQLGASWEIRHWYGSLYYRTVPNVLGKDTDTAQQLIKDQDLAPLVIQPNPNAKVAEQFPSGGEFVPVGRRVTLILTAAPVVLENFHEWTFQAATTWLNQRNILWKREPDFSTEWVEHSKPGANSTVVPGVDTVTLYLHIDDGHDPP